MSSTNKTAELQLSQFIGTDIPSILTDYNGDMQKIDAGVREVKQATAGAVSDLSSVTARVTNAEQDISGLNNTVQGIATRVITAEGDIDNLQDGVSQIESIIPATASTSNKLATIEDIGGSGAITDLQNRMTTAEGDIDDIEALIPSSATASNKLVTNKLTLVQSISRNNDEKLDDYFLRIGSKIKELVDGGNSIKNIAVECVFPASAGGFLTLESYDNEKVVYSKIGAVQDIIPRLFYIPTVTSYKEFATIKEQHFHFANNYEPGETTNYGTVTGYSVVTDYTADPSVLDPMRFDIYILN